MPRTTVRRLGVLLASALMGHIGLPRLAHAQGFEPVGVRAQGMGGAFVGVADDASATYWNPAGLASIPVFDVSLAFAGFERSRDDAAEAGTLAPAWRTRSSGFAIALPVLGVSYYRFRAARAQEAPIGARVISRQEANTGVAGDAATTWNLGVTLVQSLGDAVVVGSTLRLVNAGASASAFAADRASDALDAIDDLDTGGETKFDADLGVMAYLGQARVGLTVRNLVAPSWDSGSLLLESDRLVRVGIGWGPGPVRARRIWSIAADADLTTARAPDGDRRAVAVGAERWFRNGRVAVRGGARAQTAGDARPVATGGASVGIRSGLLLEGQLTAGGDAVERGWGLGARVTF
jgi:hypothetical protein